MKRIIFIGLAIFIAGGFYAAATYRYIEHKTNAPLTVSLNKYNLAVKTIALHDGVAAKNSTAAQTTINTLNSQKVQACQVLIAHKLVIPACQ